MTSTWELSEFDNHVKSLQFVLDDLRDAKTTAAGIGGGDLYMYGLLVGLVATASMNPVVDDFTDLITGLNDAVEATQDGIAETRRLNYEAEQTNVDASSAIVEQINQTRTAVGDLT